MKNSLLYGMIFSTLFSFAFTQAHAATSQGPADSQAKGAAFMEKNSHKAGVVTLPSGLEYEIITNGTGKKPSKNDMVTVDYEGKLLDGTVFDSSYKRGEPATFPVSGVIPGWQEALQLMNTGSTWMLYIPANLAYGSAGAGGVIGPNETLVFKVHLISIQ